MEDHLHDQHGRIGESENQDGSTTFYKGDGNSTGSLKQLLSGLKLIEKKCPQQQEASQEGHDLQMRDNLSSSDFKLHRRSPELDERSTRPKHLCSSDVSETLANVEHDDDDIDVVVGQFRNGCDNSTFDQKQDFLILPGQMENINLNQTSSDVTIKENLPDKSGTNKIDSISNFSTSKYKTVCVSSPNSSFSVIPSAGHNTTKAIDLDKLKSAKYKKEQCLNQRVGDNAAPLSMGGGPMRALNSQAKRQSSFLKSQSLEIVQDSPSIIYHETGDDDEEIFFPQLSEINDDDIKHNYQITSQYFEQHPQQLNVGDDPSDRKTKTYDTEEDIMGAEDVANTRSISFLSQKSGVALKTQSLESRPIYPNVPYSPYASPYSSPRSNRRRQPLRESRRISIEQSGSFLQLNQYKLMDQIGQGSYGLVKLAYSEEDSTHYAMKILSKRRLLRQAGLMKRGPKKSTSPLDRVYREIAVLKKLDHPNVVKLIEVLDDPLEDSLYMVFELVKQGEVLSVPTKNPLIEERAWSVFRDTLLGLEYLHYQRIIHADIKPGNLLLTECGRVKIADLGVCNEFIGEDATMTNGSTAGTPAFRAPESLNVGQNIYCGKAADIWALGATLYALVYGNVPFEAASVPALYDKIKNEELFFPETLKTTAELRDCIQSMLKKDPVDRITLPQLKEGALNIKTIQQQQAKH